MKNLIIVIVLGLSVIFITTVFSQTADEIINKHIEANGGLDNIKNIKTLIMKGTVSTHGFNLPLTITFKRKQKVRVEVTFQEISQIQAYDGKTGWKTELENGGKIPEKMTDKEIEDIKLTADFEGALVNYKKKGYSAAFLGEEKTDSSDSYKIALSKTSDTIYYYIDVKSFLILKRTKIKTDKDLQINNYYKKYKKISGLNIPTSFEVRIDDSEESQVIEFSNVEINTKVDDSIFKMPEEIK